MYQKKMHKAQHEFLETLGHRFVVVGRRQHGAGDLPAGERREASRSAAGHNEANLFFVDFKFLELGSTSGEESGAERIICQDPI